LDGKKFSPKGEAEMPTSAKGNTVEAQTEGGVELLHLFVNSSRLSLNALLLMLLNC